MSKYQCYGRSFFAALFGAHHHLVASLIGLRIESQFAWATQGTAVGAVVHAHVRVAGKNGGSVYVASVIVGVCLHKRKRSQVDIVAFQCDFLARCLFAFHDNRWNLRIAAAVGRYHFVHKFFYLPVAVVVFERLGFDAEGDAVRVPVHLHVAEHRTVVPFALNFYSLEQQSGRTIRPENVVDAEYQASSFVIVLINFRYTHQ